MIEVYTLWHFLLYASAIIGIVAFWGLVINPWINRIIESRTESIHEGCHDDLIEDDLYQHYHNYDEDNHE